MGKVQANRIEWRSNRFEGKSNWNTHISAIIALLRPKKKRLNEKKPSIQYVSSSKPHIFAYLIFFFCYFGTAFFSPHSPYKQHFIDRVKFATDWYSLDEIDSARRCETNVMSYRLFFLRIVFFLYIFCISWKFEISNFSINWSVIIFYRYINRFMILNMYALYLK